jgi:integrase
VTDKRLAEEKARQLIATLEVGFDPDRQEKAKQEHLAALIGEFLARLEPKAGAGHRAILKGRLEKMVRELKVTTLAELTPDRCRQWLHRSELAARTRSHFRTHLRQFGRFLVDTGRAPRNPFHALEPVAGIEADRKPRRRALTDDELAALYRSVRGSRYDRCGLAGPERAMLYRVAASTGLRRDELASLRPAAFRLDDEPPHVLVAARNTKNRREARQPLPAALAADLRAYLAGRPADEPVWPVVGRRTGHALRMDLKEAGIPAEVNGQRVDFHALRVCFGTRLALKNVPLALAQKLMRHSTPVLTAAVYTVAQLSDLSREVEKLG